MNVLVIHNRYMQKYIGGENIVFQQEVDCLQKYLGKERVFVYSVSNDCANRLGILFSIWFSNKHYRKVYRIVQERNIDIVHIHNFYPILTPSVFKAAKDAGAKVIHTLHNYRWWCISAILYRDGHGICELCSKKIFSFPGVKFKCYRKSYLLSLLIALAFYWYKTRNYMRYIDKYFVLTEFQKRKLIDFNLSCEKIALKPNMVETIRNPIRNKKRGFLYVGKLEESKGFGILLDILKKLNEECTFKIIGSGPMEDEVRRIKKKNIIYLGNRTHSETLRYIGCAKYLIQSSLWYETFGLTILEAMSMGTPVIGFDIGTRSEFIKDGYNGFIANQETLLDIILKANHYKDYSILSDNARRFAEPFSKENVMRQQLALYQDLMGK